MLKPLKIVVYKIKPKLGYIRGGGSLESNSAVVEWFNLADSFRNTFTNKSYNTILQPDRINGKQPLDETGL